MSETGASLGRGGDPTNETREQKENKRNTRDVGCGGKKTEEQVSAGWGDADGRGPTGEAVR